MPFSLLGHSENHEAGLPSLPADLHYPATPAELGTIAELRHVLSRWAAGLGLASDRVQDLVLASYEAMANVVVHAYPGQPGVFDLYATLSAAGQVTVTVTDYGHWQPALVDDAPPGQGGRGLPLIRALATDTTIHADSGGTSVRMRWDT